MKPSNDMPKQQNRPIDIMLWYSIFYLKWVIVFGGLFFALYFYDELNYWFVLVILPTAFAAYDWARSYKKIYGDSPNIGLVYKGVVITYPVSVTLITFISFFYWRHHADMTPIFFIKLLFETEYLLLGLSIIIHYCLFVTAVYLSDIYKYRYKVPREIGERIGRRLYQNRKAQLFAVVCLFLAFITIFFSLELASRYVSDFDQGRRTFDVVSAKGDDDHRTLMRRANAKFRMEDFKDAISDYDQVLKLNDNHRHAYFKRGLAKFYIERYEDAIIDFDAVIIRAPNHIKAYQKRSAALRKLGHYNEAKADCDKAQALSVPLINCY